MTDLSKINANTDIGKFGLVEKVTIEESGKYNIPADLWEVAVLEPNGVSLSTFNKIEKDSARLQTAMVLHGGNLSVEHFKANPEALELGWNYQQGSLTNVSTIYNRDAKDHTVMSVETKCKSADMKRVLSYLGDEFANINS